MKQSEEAVKSLKKIPFKIKVGYGVTGWATLFTFTVFTTYGLYFFTDVAGLAPAFAGLLLAIGTLWDAVTDPLIGAWTDKRDPAKGRRRPFIFAVALPFGIVSWLMFTNWGFEDLGTKVYFMLIVIAYYSVQTLLDIPYTALGAEMTKDYDERSSLNSHRAFWATVGSILTGFTLILVSYFTELTENEYLGWSITNAVFGIFITISILIGWRATKGYELHVEPQKKFSFKDLVNGPLKNKPFILIAVMFALGISAQCMFDSSSVYFFMYNLGLSENQVGTLYIFLWVAAVPFIPVLDFICVKFSKKAAWLIGLGAWAADMLIFPWLVMHPDKIFFAYLFMGIASIGFMAVYQVAWSIIPDAVEVDEYKTGQRREGLYYGAVTFIQKCAAAAAFAIAGLVLTNIGYDPEIESQSAVTLTGLKGMLSFGTAGFLILSCITAVFHPMTRTRHAALLKGIEDKKLNKKVDESLFKAVL